MASASRPGASEERIGKLEGNLADEMRVITQRDFDQRGLMKEAEDMYARSRKPTVLFLRATDPSRVTREATPGR